MIDKILPNRGNGENEMIILNDLIQFLKDYPGMSRAPWSGYDICLRGILRFKANTAGENEVEDFYKLEIVVPHGFPQDLPRVKEIDNKIPRDGNFHVNPDGTLCLGSPLRLLKKIYNTPSLSGFTEKCLIPYLYAVSHKLMHGGNFVFGELAHGEQGIVDDYLTVLGLQEKDQITQAIQLLGVKKRVANKNMCPCGCGKRLGVCPYRYKLNEFRKMAPMSWFRMNTLM